VRPTHLPLVLFAIVLAMLAVNGGPVRRASADAPNDREGQPRRERPVALELDFGFGFGGIQSGAQRHLPLYPPSDALTLKLGLGARCFWHHVGGEVELDRSDSRGLQAEVLRLGGAVELARSDPGDQVGSLELGAGANHTWLRLLDGIGPATVAAGRPAPDDVATGLGYYVHLDFRLEDRVWWTPRATFNSSIGVQYEYLGPRFSASPKPFDAHNLEGRVRFGARF